MKQVLIAGVSGAIGGALASRLLERHKIKELGVDAGCLSVIPKPG